MLAMARYSALADDLETLACFLDFHDTREFPRKMLIIILVIEIFLSIIVYVFQIFALLENFYFKLLMDVDGKLLNDIGGKSLINFN